ncbi:hypothetical protein [Bradyrhizobium sp. USDA 4506]
MSDDIAEVVERIRAGAVPIADLERLGAALSSRMPPRDRDERDFLLRQFLRRLGAKSASGRAQIKWLTAEVSKFRTGPDWRAARHKLLSPFTDERRLLLWRILKFGDLPARSTLAEILNRRQ